MPMAESHQRDPRNENWRGGSNDASSTEATGTPGRMAAHPGLRVRSGPGRRPPPRARSSCPTAKVWMAAAWLLAMHASELQMHQVAGCR